MAEPQSTPDDDDDTPPVREIPPAPDAAREIRPFSLFGDGVDVEKDFRPLPVDSADLEVSAQAPKGLSAVESVDSSTTQEDSGKTQKVEITSPAQSVPTAPAGRVTGTPPPPDPSTPTSSEAQKAG